MITHPCLSSIDPSRSILPEVEGAIESSRIFVSNTMVLLDDYASLPLFN
jgi:hypothetical protein